MKRLVIVTVPQDWPLAIPADVPFVSAHYDPAQGVRYSPGMATLHERLARIMFPDFDWDAAPGLTTQGPLRPDSWEREVMLRGIKARADVDGPALRQSVLNAARR